MMQRFVLPSSKEAGARSVRALTIRDLGSSNLRSNFWRKAQTGELEVGLHAKHACARAGSTRRGEGFGHVMGQRWGCNFCRVCRPPMPSLWQPTVLGRVCESECGTSCQGLSIETCLRSSAARRGASLPTQQLRTGVCRLLQSSASLPAATALSASSARTLALPLLSTMACRVYTWINNWSYVADAGTAHSNVVGLIGGPFCVRLQNLQSA